MPSRTETEDVWRSIPGAQPLFDIYGYWPALHDGYVHETRFDFDNRSVEIVVDYNDGTDHAEQEANTAQRITLRWQGVRDSKLRIFEDGIIYGMDFTRRAEGIETVFEQAGYILSESVEVTAIEPGLIRTNPL